MNWGHKITFAYLGFVLFMVTLVVLCFKQKDLFLVTNNYYDDEINYEKRIEKIRNANAFLEPLSISLNEKSDTLTIDLSKKSLGSTGTISFYRPSNQKMDLTFPLNLNADGVQKIFVGNKIKGLWNIEVEWLNAGVPFYFERKIQI